MLRASLRSSRAIGRTTGGVNPAAQWQSIHAGRVASGAMRGYAENKKSSINDSRPIVLPGSASSATSEPLPPGRVSTTINAELPEANILPPSGASAAIPKAPLSPPTPEAVNSVVPPPPPPSASPAPVQKPRRFFRKFFLTLIILSTLGYGGGIYYSRINDNFHDFFTEYVPFGEDAVLYFEEREFRKKYPKRGSTPPRDTGALTRIPSQSGVSWRVAEDTRHANATSNAKEALKDPSESKQTDKVAAVKAVKAPEASKPAPPPPAPKVEAPVTKPVLKKEVPAVAKNAEVPVSKKAEGVAFVEPEVDQPSRFPPEVTRIDSISVKDDNEPLVQELVNLLNEIITVANQDSANSRFSGTFEKAKKELSRVGGQIQALKAAAQKEAADKINAEKSDFDRAAKELIRRLEAEMGQQQAQWQEEYQTERKRIQDNYEQKLKAEVEQAHKVNEQKLENSLLEQATELKKKFMADVKSRVEEEREGRLGKLVDLSSSVNELEKLTTDWSSIVDSNLKTQHLHVAVEAVRSNLEKTQVPRPFTKELAALKEIASDDPVVNAAIASINPSAYQRGVPSSAHLIDRFRRVAGEVRKASLLPEEAGVASHASSYVLSKLLFKKKGLAVGDDVESILTRTETFLEEGDLDGAAREMNGLQGWAKTLSRDWLGEVRKVLEVQQALEVIATEARLQSLRVETSTVPPRPTAAEILAHHSYPDAVWKLQPTQSGKLDVAKGRGGPLGISWEVHGKGEKKIVFVVGLGGVKWAYQRQTLNFGHEKADEYSVLVLDNRGIGESDKPILRYSTTEMALDLIEVLAHLSWTKERELNIVGVSMGGMIAQEIACLIPTRVNTLSLFSTAAYIKNTTGFFENMRQRFQMFVPKSLDRSLVDASATMFPAHWLDQPDNASVPSPSTPNVEFPANGVYQKFATNYERWAAQELTKKTDPTQFGKKGFMLQAVAAGWHHKSAEQLQKMGDEVGRERIAVIHGDMDRMISLWHGETLMEMLKPGKAITRERCGHVILMEETQWHDEFLEEQMKVAYALNAQASA